MERGWFCVLLLVLVGAVAGNRNYTIGQRNIETLNSLLASRGALENSCIASIVGRDAIGDLSGEAYVPEGTEEWCKCMEETGLIAGGRRWKNWRRVFKTCRAKILKGKPTNNARICMGMSSFLNDYGVHYVLGRTFCDSCFKIDERKYLLANDYHYELPYVMAQDVGCHRRCGRALQPTFCKEFDLTYTPLRINPYYASEPSVRDVVFRGEVLFTQEITESYKVDKLNAELLCSKVSPGDPDQCCSYTRGAGILGSCCSADASGAMKFNCASTEPVKDPCMGMCNNGDCVIQGGSAFCVQCNSFFRGTLGGNSPCCSFDEATSKCKKSDSVSKKCMAGERYMYVHTPGLTLDAAFADEKEGRPVCRNAWNFWRNGAACVIKPALDGDGYECKYRMN